MFRRLRDSVGLEALSLTSAGPAVVVRLWIRKVLGIAGMHACIPAYMHTHSSMHA